MSGGPGPVPDPFDPLAEHLPVGTRLYRVHNAERRPTEFNPKYGGGGRFHFFNAPNAEGTEGRVPVLYLGATRDVAIAETVFHHIPAKGGVVSEVHYRGSGLSEITVTRELRLAAFLGRGLMRLRTEPSTLTGCSSRHYPETRLWAQAAHRTGFDGIVWMSRIHNVDRAYVLFGDRVAESDLARSTAGVALALDTGEGLEELIRIGGEANVTVRPPR